jgi:gluconokinase
LGGALSDGGNVYAWLSATLADAAPLPAVQPDGHGLTVLPLLAGERTPGVQSHLKAAMVGYTLATSPAEVVQAHLEAVAYRIRLLVERLPTVYEIRASGGALAQSPAWAQVLCDVLGQPLKLPAIDETAARGAALLTFDALGVPTSASMPMQTLTPNMAHYDTYSRALERYQHLYDVFQSVQGNLFN